jgi:beta-alanine degradation protein BauB
MKKFTTWMFTLVFLAVACVLGLRAAFAAGDPLTVGPEIYKLKFENDRVRVMDIAFAPGAKIDMHTHPDHIAVITQAGKLTLSFPDGTTKDMEGKVGDAFFIPAETHAAQNTGGTEVKGIVIELKGPAPVADAERAAVSGDNAVEATK